MAATWKGSGTLVGAAIAVVGFAADTPNALATGPVQYPRDEFTAQCKLSLFITTNGFVATTTRFEIYKDTGAGPLPTGKFIDVPANGGVPNGLLQATFALGFVSGNTFDLRVSNPGGGAEVGKVIAFGYSAEFF